MTADTHPLMPGIRSAEIQSTDWPRTLHDRQLTGFSPLVCGMSDAPSVWRTLATPGDCQWIRPVDTRRGAGFLVDDGRLRLFDVSGGECLWTAPASGHLAHWGDLYGDGAEVALLRSANRLTVVDGDSGEIRWSQTYDPPHVDLRVAVCDVLPVESGRQVAVFEQYGDAGWLLSFAPDGAVYEVWRRQVIANDVWPVRADHGCDIAVEHHGDRWLIWNVRHHRCQSFDAATGELVGVLQYQIEGAIRRNYGPWRICRGADGQRMIVVAAEMVQTHVHGLRLHEDGTPELAWWRNYGGVYDKPGVAVQFLGVLDVHGVGDELLYNVRDPEFDCRSFVRSRAAGDGTVTQEWADTWGSALVQGVGSESRDLLLLHPAQGGAMPEQGPLQIVACRGAEPQIVFEHAHAGPWGACRVPGADGADLLLRTVEDGRAAVTQFDGDQLHSGDVASDSEALAMPASAILRQAGQVHWASTSGLWRWPGIPTGTLDLQGGAPATLSAADLGDGHARLFAHVRSDRLQAWDLGGSDALQRLDLPFLGDPARHSPLLYDLDGDGQLEVVVPGASATCELTVRAVRPDGTTVWSTTLPNARTDDAGKVVAWNAGAFLEAGKRAGLAISVFSTRRALEGTFMLRGDDGEVLWFRDIYRDGDKIRAYKPQGLPGAFDWDGDGAEEIVWDMYSYIAFLRGDGELAAIFGGRDMRTPDKAVEAIQLYNGYTPIYRSAQDDKPHWFVHHGHGRFGVTAPDPLQTLWFEDEGYDTPDRVGCVDVDGDGEMEVGYALRNSRQFVCRDLWTGAVKWRVELPGAPVGPVITADVDGDGKGEFLLDRWCIGTDDEGSGQIRWTAPVSMGWAIIADLDGDGYAEIACPGSARITVLRAATS